MKKSLLISLALMLCCGIAFAQTTVTGTVVDTKGNPMPGAKVQVKGTNDYVITNIDGTFSINLKNPKSTLVSDYVGWNTSKDRAKDGMVIKMKKTTWWTEKPKKWQWFAAVNAVMPAKGDLLASSITPGLMLGMVKDWGWYAKAFYKGQTSNHEYCDTPYTGKSKGEYKSLTLGAIKRLWSPIYLYLGVGGVEYDVLDERVCGNYTKRYMHEDYGEYGTGYSDLVGDVGIMVRFKKMFVQGGIQLPMTETGANPAPNFGVGYIF